MIYGFIFSAFLSAACAWATVGFTVGHSYNEAAIATIVLMVAAIGMVRIGLQPVLNHFHIEEPRETLPVTALIAGLFGYGTMLSGSEHGALVGCGLGAFCLVVGLTAMLACGVFEAVIAASAKTTAH